MMIKRLSLFLCMSLFAGAQFLMAQDSYTVSSNTQQPDSTLIEQMRQERDAFLVKLSNGIQREQEDAIQTAMKGDYAPLRHVRSMRNMPYTLPKGVKVAETTAQKMRLYLPADATENDSLPLLLYAHGGGWTFGSLNSCAAFCCQMAEQGVAVLAIDYPLSPEQPFPAAMNACSAAYDYAVTMARSWGVDPARIFMGGDSAGGNLALSMALSRSSQNKTLPAGILAFYPVTKVWTDLEAPSWQQYGLGYALDAALMKTMNEAYMGKSVVQNYLLSPALATPGQLKKLPATLIIGGTADILFDQGQAFYQKMKSVNPLAQTYVLPEASHLFITVDGQPTARQLAIQRSIQFMFE